MSIDKVEELAKIGVMAGLRTTSDVLKFVQELQLELRKRDDGAVNLTLLEAAAIAGCSAAARAVKWHDEMSRVLGEAEAERQRVEAKTRRIEAEKVKPARKTKAADNADASAPAD